jgi:hypothetical protein
MPAFWAANVRMSHHVPASVNPLASVPGLSMHEGGVEHEMVRGTAFNGQRGAGKNHRGINRLDGGTDRASPAPVLHKLWPRPVCEVDSADPPSDGSASVNLLSALLLRVQAGDVRSNSAERSTGWCVRS